MASRHVGGLVFVGLMFLGMGLGLLVERPDVGLFVGMGLGFIAMAFLRGGAEEKGAEATPRPPSLPAGSSGGRFGAALLLGLGAIFLALGVVQLLGLAVPERVVGALFLVALGLGFLWWGGGASALWARVG